MSHAASGLNAALDALRGLRWEIATFGSPQPLLSAAQAERYPTLPVIISDSLGLLKHCHNAEQTAWIYGPAEYAQADPVSFRWDECERLSLGAAESTDETSQVASFWNVHLPFAMACHTDYEYLAVSLSPGPHFGAIVHGVSPALEDCSTIFPTFDAFLIGLAEQARTSFAHASLWPWLSPHG
jgi:hypothetical protein